MFSLRRHSPYRRFVAVAWWAYVGTCASRAYAEDFHWEWSPTHVAVSIVVDPDPDLSPALVRRTAAAVVASMRAEFGAAVKGTVVELDPAAAVRWSESLTSGGPASAEIASTETELRKRCVVRLARGPTGYSVEAREWDVDLGLVGPLVRRTVSHRDLIAATAAEAATSGFRPPARIDEVRQNVAIMRLRGGSLFPAEATSRLLRIGDGFAPVLRRRNADGSLQPAVAVPWTLLAVKDVRGPVVEAAVVTGLRNPLGGRNRSRTEQWAVAVGRSSEPTELTLTAQRGGSPLAGCRVFAGDDGNAAHLVGTTDERGRIVVPSAEGCVRTIVVTTRYLPLAKFPLAPGSIPRLTAAVPGDPTILETEYWLADWQAEFTDLYIQRRVLATLASARIEQGSLDAARSLLDALDQVGSPRTQVESLELRRRTTKVDGPIETRLLDRLFGDSLDVVRKLDDSAVQAELRSRLAAAAKPRATAPPP